MTEDSLRKKWKRRTYLTEIKTEHQLRELRGKYMTIRLNEVVKCGHKLDLNRVPTRNCVPCWEAFFKLSEVTKDTHALLAKGGEKAIGKKYGTKFVKAFRGFLHNELMNWQPPKDVTAVPMFGAKGLEELADGIPQQD